MNKILIVDDSTSDKRVILGLLTKVGYDSLVVESIEAGKAELKKLSPSSVVMVSMKCKDGMALDLIRWAKMRGYINPIIVIIDRFDASDVYEVLRNHGAVDVIQRPALDKTLVETLRQYSHNCGVIESPHNSIFHRQSSIYRNLLDKVDKIVHTDLNVLIVGESGVGKEPLAEEIHRRSARNDKPCVILDASVLHLQDHKHKILYEGIRNKLVKAVGGTVIIDHIHMITPEIRHILSDIIKAEQYDIRFITLIDSAHHPPEPSRIISSYLRYKLSQYVINVPPLRECRDDIVPLATFFLNRYKEEFRLNIKGFDSEAKKKLLSHPWPGNIRELKNVIRSAAIEATKEVITAKDLEIENPGLGPPPRFALRDDGDEKARIIAALEHTGGKRQEAAALLKINRNTLQNKIKKYGIDTNFK